MRSNFTFIEKGTTNADKGLSVLATAALIQLVQIASPSLSSVEPDKSALVTVSVRVVTLYQYLMVE